MRTVTVFVHEGESRRDWCETCLTSAHITTDICKLGDEGISVIATVSGCKRCKTGVFAADGPLAA